MKRCICKTSGDLYAVKVIDKKLLNGKTEQIDREVNVLKQCDHKNIVRLHDCFDTPEKVYIVMDLSVCKAS